jgi:hypothetical protein
VTEAVTIRAARELRPVVSRSNAARGRVFQVLMAQNYPEPLTVTVLAARVSGPVWEEAHEAPAGG